jgi:hypothetical protein
VGWVWVSGCWGRADGSWWWDPLNAEGRARASLLRPNQMALLLVSAQTVSRCPFPFFAAYLYPVTCT